MAWLSALNVLAETKLPTGYRLTSLARCDVPEVVQKLREWYPDIVVGAESCHLEPDFYYQQAMLGDDDSDRSILPVIARHGPSLVAVITFEKNVRSLTITSRMGAVDPAHRGPGLGLLGPLLLERIGRSIGAQLAYYFATLKSQHQQVLAERAKFRLVGIVPAFDRDMVRPGEVKRVYEAIHAKVLVGDDAVLVPPADALTLKTQVLWQTLFGHSE
jgi:hypothetical protein